MAKLNDDDELQFLDMDDPQTRNTYDSSKSIKELNPDMSNLQPRNTCPELGTSPIKISGLEEVAEMSEESDLTSQYDREYLEKTSSSSESSSEQLNLEPQV